jgi:phenylpropionate dioxygenase-like ring-hydroxylating dioxygenase large terminal subunit
VDVPYTWRPTGWFQIGWSRDFPADRAVALRYFGEDLAAWRGDDGALHVSQAHCPHFGAHLGHGGRVDGDCVTCPYHGWVWGPDGENVAIPYEDRPNRSKRLRVWPVVEQYGSVYLWHHPEAASPTWEMPDIFTSFPQFETDPSAYYEPVTAKASREPVHPQVVAENGPDSVHFAYVHRASVTPVALDYAADGPIWKFLTGWPNTRVADPGSRDPDDMVLRIHSWLAGLGGSLTAFDGVQQHRLTFTVTPVEHGVSDLFYTVWWPRLPGDTSPTPPPDLAERIDKEFLSTMEDDLEIWRYQRYVEHPALARQDAKPYKALRAWAQQFYDEPPRQRPR